MVNETPSTLLLRRDLFRDIDIALAKLLMRLAPEDPPGVFLAALLASRATGDGNVCIDLHHWGGQILGLSRAEGKNLPCPEVDPWVAQLRDSDLVGSGQEDRPLVIDDRGRVYLQRLYRDEQQLAAALRRRALAESPPFPAVPTDGVPRLLDRYFPGPLPEDQPDWQKIAALVTLSKRLCIISGAPGTGKTTTVAKILGVLLELAHPCSLRIHLCTPTGKAAARLGAALAETTRQLDCPPSVASSLAALEPSTIHRLLRMQPAGKGFHHNASNPLPTDLVVVDEASMVDLVLMSRLVRAVPDAARLVILGDKDQLASVDAGAVFGDLCRDAARTPYSPPMQKALAAMTPVAIDPAPAAQHPPSVLGDCLVVLRKNYRFDSQAGIGVAAQAINAGNAEQLKRALRQKHGQGLRWEQWRTHGDYHKLLAAIARSGYETYLASRDPEEALANFSQFMMLSALATGPFGVDRLNALAMEALQQGRLIGRNRPWYAGRPVMITRNHYPLGLYNGDTGVAWPDSAGRLNVWFEGEGGDLRALHPLQLPPHQTVFAMTVHKSQGSEFDHVLLVLPDRDTPILTRELLYTGCTRARRQLTLVAREDVLDLAVSRTIQRTSGLIDALRRDTAKAPGH